MSRRVAGALALLLVLLSGTACAPGGSGRTRAVTVVAPRLPGPLHTDGRWIVDRSGHRVKLVGVNWSGAETPAFAVGGLDVRPLDDLAALVRRGRLRLRPAALLEPARRGEPGRRPALPDRQPAAAGTASPRRARRRDRGARPARGGGRAGRPPQPGRLVLRHRARRRPLVHPRLSGVLLAGRLAHHGRPVPVGAERGRRRAAQRDPTGARGWRPARRRPRRATAMRAPTGARRPSGAGTPSSRSTRTCW